jgi:AcrR family transcriptional regulator
VARTQDRAARGPRRRRLVTVEEIVDAALAIVDAEGLEALSMRSLAHRLRIGTMTLYHYVRDKDELAELVSDRVMSEVLIPGEVPADWREALSEIARRTRATFLRHPWIVDAFGHQHTITASVLRHVEQTIAAIASLEADPDSAAAIVGAVDDYAMGHAIREIVHERWAGQGPAAHQLSAGARRLLERGELSETLRAFLEEGGPPHRADDFDDGLRWLLDGFEADRVARRRRRRV